MQNFNMEDHIIEIGKPFPGLPLRGEIVNLSWSDGGMLFLFALADLTPREIAGFHDGEIYIRLTEITKFMALFTVNITDVGLFDLSYSLYRVNKKNWPDWSNAPGEHRLTTFVLCDASRRNVVRGLRMGTLSEPFGRKLARVVQAQADHGPFSEAAERDAAARVSARATAWWYSNAKIRCRLGD